MQDVQRLEDLLKGEFENQSSTTEDSVWSPPGGYIHGLNIQMDSEVRLQTLNTLVIKLKVEKVCQVTWY